jgi:5-methylcytosine-specific restriction endonuclease McrA
MNSDMVIAVQRGDEEPQTIRLGDARPARRADGARPRRAVVARSRKARAARRRKRRMDRVDHDLSEAQWTALTAAWGGCAYCGASNTPLQRDCVLALSRGGRYTLGNIVPVCRSCNASKCNAEVTGWLRRKRLDERAFLLRHLEINAALALQFQGPDAQ